MVSIVIPVYNVENYILFLLKSIAMQSYQDFELLIVNDGSIDNSLENIKKYKKENPNMIIHIINQENKGVSFARNIGISKARGDYICFLDADDMIDLSYLEIMVKEIERNHADIVMCRSRIIEDDSELLFMNSHDYEKKMQGNIEVLHEMLYGRVNSGIWALLCKRTIIGDLRFAEGYKYSEDLEMVWKLIASSKKIIRIDAKLYNYRIRKGSAMSIVDERRIDGYILFQKLEKFIEQVLPEFSVEFNKYGVATWVWSTVWQEALAAKSYSEFKQRVLKYSADSNMKNLKDFNVSKVRILAKIFIYLKPVYYYLIKLLKHNYRKNEEMYE